MRDELPSPIQFIADESFCLYEMSWWNACAASTIVPLLEYGVATMRRLNKLLGSLFVKRTGLIRLFYKETGSFLSFQIVATP